MLSGANEEGQAPPSARLNQGHKGLKVLRVVFAFLVNSHQNKAPTYFTMQCMHKILGRV